MPFCRNTGGLSGRPIHAWRWRGSRYEILCGLVSSAALIHPEEGRRAEVTCGNCRRVLRAQERRAAPEVELRTLRAQNKALCGVADRNAKLLSFICGLKCPADPCFGGRAPMPGLLRADNPCPVCGGTGKHPEVRAFLAKLEADDAARQT